MKLTEVSLCLKKVERMLNYEDRSKMYMRYQLGLVQNLYVLAQKIDQLPLSFVHRRLWRSTKLRQQGS